jgi:endonuclease/exonuclease/phosphatase family metal-dependent hydrolase
MEIKLASYNIQYGVGKDDRLDLQRIVDELRDADIIALQEVESGNPTRGFLNQPEEILTRLSHEHSAFCPGIDRYIGETVPGGHPGLRQKFGNMIISRWPISSVLSHALPKVALHRTQYLQCTVIESVISTPAAPLRFYCTHLDYVSPMTRGPQIKALSDIILNAKERGAPLGGVEGDSSDLGPNLPWPEGAILMGDLNFAPNSKEYDLMIGDVSPMTGNRIFRQNGLFDAWLLTGHDAAEGSTFEKPGRAQQRLDYCFVTSELTQAVKSMEMDEDALGSDHQPIFVTIEL